jgi:hypothetical protein
MRKHQSPSSHKIRQGIDSDFAELGHLSAFRGRFDVRHINAAAISTARAELRGRECMAKASERSHNNL